MDFDLRTSKLQKEAEQRKLEAKKRRERELKLEAEQKLRTEKLAQLAMERKEARDREELEKQEMLALETIKTGGIHCFATKLKPNRFEEDDDKVILPESVLTTLNEQDAFGRGPVLFEVMCQHPSFNNGHATLVTHCGVKEFSASEGQILLPDKVFRSILTQMERKSPGFLVSKEVEDALTVSVKYVRLPKVTHVTFKPTRNENGDIFALGPIKHCLEENLRKHATLTEGDTLTVWYRGKCYALSVTKLLPEPQGTVIDTDVEVEFADEAVATAAATPLPTEATPSNNVSSVFNVGGNQAGPLSSITATASVPSSLSNPIPLNSASQSISALAESTVEMSSTVLERHIPPEPDAQVPEVMQIRIRLPDGRTLNRRFLPSNSANSLLAFVANSGQVNPSAVSLNCRSLHADLTASSLQELEIAKQNQHQEGSFVELTLSDLGLGKREMLIASFNV